VSLRPLSVVPLRVVFLGSDGIALPMLDWIVSQAAGEVEIVGVFTQPDRPAGRGQKALPNAIKSWAATHGIPVFQPERIDAGVGRQLADLKPDLSLVMAYGHILRDDFIGLPRLGTLNLHTSLLPKFRGASPIQTAIATEEKESGVTLMRIIRALDAGPIADRELVQIEPDDTALELEARLSRACVPLMARAFPRLIAGTLEFTEQNPEFASYCRRLLKEDGGLDFGRPAPEIAARIRGLHPWPGCAIELGGITIKLGMAEARLVLTPELAESAARAGIGHAPGTVMGRSTEGLWLAAGQGFVILRRLQRPGGRMLPALEFLRGFEVESGSIAPSRSMAAVVATQPFPHRPR